MSSSARSWRRVPGNLGALRGSERCERVSGKLGPNPELGLLVVCGDLVVHRGGVTKEANGVVAVAPGLFREAPADPGVGGTIAHPPVFAIPVGLEYWCECGDRFGRVAGEALTVPGRELAPEGVGWVCVLGEPDEILIDGQGGARVTAILGEERAVAVTVQP